VQLRDQEGLAGQFHLLVDCLGHTGIGLFGNVRIVQDVIDDAILKTPLDKIELTDSRREALKLDALCTTERVEQLLAVAVKTALVGYMYRKLLTGWRLVCHLLILGIVGHKPLQVTQRDAVPVCKDVSELVAVIWFAEESP